ncbi:Ulp1 protease family, C-terminal catalytic domain [Phytophthora cactorum]|nr:Ulp1 protease family, C-terminal catalytic domain [Phytophthora cactorum]
MSCHSESEVMLQAFRWSKRRRRGPASNELVLLALHVDNNHWCVIVFDFRPESRSITRFDPLQARKSKYYEMCDKTLCDLFGEMYATMEIKKETRSRQPDGASCGVMVLMFSSVSSVVSICHQSRVHHFCDFYDFVIY